MLGLICGMWDLVPWPRELNPDSLGLNPRPLAFLVQSLTYRTTTELPIVTFKNIILVMSLSLMISHCSWIKMKLLNVALSSYLGWFCLSLPCLTGEGLATHSSTLAWRIPWREEPGRRQSMGSQRVRHDWVTSLSCLTSISASLYTSLNVPCSYCVQGSGTCYSFCLE